MPGSSANSLPAQQHSNRPDAPSRAAEVLAAVMALPSAARDAQLAALCADEPHVRDEVRSLIDYADRSDGLLDEIGRLTTIETAELLAENTPARIGEYPILRPLGEGTFSSVYLGRQPRTHQSVAIKTLHPHLSPRNHRRFELEPELQARMSHPGIARVLEVGTADIGHGPRPFLVMEYVEGERLDHYCEIHALSKIDRMRLFIDLSQAIQHAHQRGVVHCDLKPGNILVTPDGQPKVVDFGVSRFTDTDLNTTLMHEPLGTIAYMSPEQADFQPARIDARTDIYALGVILYELLVRRMPYDLDGLSAAQALRIVAERPARFDALTRRILGRDLETVLAKALEKDVERRYASVAALIEDVENVLDHRPVSIRRESLLYVLRKAARRHRFAVAALVVIAAAVTTAGGVSVYQARKTGLALTVAQSVLRAQFVPPIGGEAGRAIQRQNALLASVAQAEQTLGPRDYTTGLAYFALGSYYYQDMKEWQAAEAPLKRAIDILAEADSGSVDCQTARNLLLQLLFFKKGLSDREKRLEVVKLCEDAISEARSRPGDEYIEISFIDAYGFSLVKLGEHERAVAAFERECELAEILDKPDLLLRGMDNRSATLMLMKRHADSLLSDYVLMERFPELPPPTEIRVRERLGANLVALDRAAEAPAELERGIAIACEIGDAKSASRLEALLAPLRSATSAPATQPADAR